MTSRFLYTDADTFIHRLHPNTKLLCMVLLFAAVLAFNHPIHEAAFVVLGIILLALSASLANLLRTWKFLTIIFVMATLLWVLFVRDIEKPDVVWQMKPALIERATAPYDLMIIILMAGLLMLAVTLLSLVQILIRDLARFRGSLAWWLAFGAALAVGLLLLWKGGEWIPSGWPWYTALGLYFIASTIVILARLRPSYGLPLWLALVLVSIAMYFALSGFIIHLQTPANRFLWGPSITISQQALLYGPAMGLRIVAFLLFGLVFISTTSPEQLTQGLRSIGTPITPSISLSLAFRLVPSFAQTARTVMQAQTSRGLELDKGGPLHRLRRSVPVVLPTLLYALRSADDLTVALETRGLAAKSERTEYRELSSGSADVLAAIFCVAFAAVCIIARISFEFGELLPRL